MVIFLYLLAVVFANLTISYFGEIGLYITGFIIIPFDLFSRDILHEKWKNKHLFRKMAILIFSGSLLSFLINNQSLDISIASFFAFMIAGSLNTFVYNRYFDKSILIKMNLSNFVAVIADSLVFISIVFGLKIDIIITQIAIKFIGGFAWSYIYYLYRKK